MDPEICLINDWSLQVTFNYLIKYKLCTNYYNTTEFFSWIIWQKKIAVSQHIKKNGKQCLIV